MDNETQIEAFYNEVGALVVRFMNEFDVPVAALIGVLQMHVIGLSGEALGMATIDDDDD